MAKIMERFEKKARFEVESEAESILNKQKFYNVECPHVSFLWVARA